MTTPPLYQRVCPNCGKAIPRLVKLPRDLGLLVHCLIYRVPVEAEITAAWIETARKHCKMRPGRLAELQSSQHSRHWQRMLAKRAARFDYFKQHGRLPNSGELLLQGEPNRTSQNAAFRRYRKGGLAKLKARLRKSPDAQAEKLANRYAATRKIRKKSRRAAATDDLFARLVTDTMARTGKITLGDYEVLRELTLSDDEFPRRFRRHEKRAPATGSTAEAVAKNGRGEDNVDVPTLPAPSHSTDG